MARPKITVKEAKLVKAKVKGLTHKQAYDEAGYAPTNYNSSVVNTNKILSRPNVQEALAVALEKHNITPDRTLNRVSEALDAEKVTIVGNGDQSMAEITPDHSTRLSAVKIAHNLMGIGQSKETPTTANYVQIINEKGSKYNV